MKQKVKDLRKVYKYQEIRVPGNVIHFDGKGNPETKTLKMYRIHGDVTRFKEAIELFATSNGYEQVYTPNF